LLKVPKTARHDRENDGAYSWAFHLPAMFREADTFLIKCRFQYKVTHVAADIATDVMI
jgi:hypothetical protein